MMFGLTFAMRRLRDYWCVQPPIASQLCLFLLMLTCAQHCFGAGKHPYKERLDHYGDRLPRGARERLGTIRLRHSGGVNAVAFSPTGRTLASAGETDGLRIWDLATGRQTGGYSDGPICSLQSMAYSPDGAYIAFANVSVVRIYDVRVGKVVANMKGHVGVINAVAFSRDGKCLFSAGDDKTIIVWSVPAGKRVGVINAHSGPVNTISVSADGKFLASGGDDHALRLWTLPTRKLVGTIWFEKDIPHALCFSPDSEKIISSEEDSLIRLWDVRSRREVGRIKGTRTGIVRVAAISQDGRLLASGGVDAAIQLWDLKTLSKKRQLRYPGSSLQALAFSPDGQTLASGATDGSVRVWNVISGKEEHATIGHMGRITSIAFSGNQRMCSRGTDQSVIVWKRTRRGWGEILLKREGMCFAFDPSGAKVLIGGLDGVSRLWNVNSGKELHQYGKPAPPITALALYHDGSKFLIGDVRGHIDLWSIRTGKMLQRIRDPKRHGTSVTSIAITADGKRMALTDLSGAAILSDPAGKEVRRLTDPSITCKVVFSPDGTILALVLKDMVELWDASTGKTVFCLKPEEGSLCAVTFSPNGQFLAAGTVQGKIMVWELRSGKRKMELKGGQGAIMDLCFSPDGKSLASAGSDTTVLFWDTSSVK